MRRISRLAGTLFFALLIIAGGSFVSLQAGEPSEPEGDSSFIASRLSSLLSFGPRFQVRIGKLEGQFPFRLQADRITISDPEGVWATAEKVVFRWSPLALVRLLIHIEEISAQRILVERLPEASEEVEEPPAGQPMEGRDLLSLPQPLRRLTVGTLAVGQIELERDALGHKGVFHLEGSLEEPESASGRTITLHAERTDDGPQLQVDLKADFIHEDPRRLLVEAALQESPEGILAALLGHGNVGPIHLALRGDGPLDAWKGALEGGAGKFGVVHADIGMEALRDIRLALSGNYEPARDLVSPQLAPLLGEETRFDLIAQYAPSQSVAFEGANILGAGYRLQFSGSLGLESRAIAGSWVLGVEDLAVLQPLAGAPIEGELAWSGELSGTMDQPRATMLLQLQRLQTRGFGVNAVRTEFLVEPLDPQAPDLSGFNITGSGSAEGLSALSGPPLPEDSLQWAVEATVPFDRDVLIQRVQIDGAHHAVELSGSIDPQELAGSLGAVLRVKNLEPVTAYLGQELPGAATVQAHLTGSARTLSGSGEIEGQLTATGDEYPPAIAGLIAPELSFAAKIRLDDGARLTVPEFHAESPAFRLTSEVAANLSQKSLEAVWQILIPQMDPLEPALGTPVAGTLHAGGEIRGTFDALAVTANLKGDSITVSGNQIQEVIANLQAKDIPQAPGGDLDLAVVKSGERIDASTAFALRGETLSLSSITLEAPGNRLKGDLQIHTANFLLEGNLQGDLKTLSTFGRLLDEPIQGSATLQARLFHGEDGQKLEGSISGKDLESRFGSVRSLSVSADLSKLRDAPQGRMKADIQGLQRPDVTLVKAAIDISGSLDRADFKASLAGKRTEEFDIQTRGVFARAQPSYRVQVSELKGRFGAYPVSLFQPVSIGWSPEGLSLDGMALGFGKGRIEASGSLDPSRVGFDAGVEELPLSALSLFGGPELNGSASGKLLLRGNPSNPSADMDLRLTNVRSPASELKDVPPGDVTADAVLEGGRLDAAVEIRGVVREPVAANLSVPVDFSLSPFQAALRPYDPLQGRLDARVDLKTLSPLIPLDDQVIGGDVAVNLQAAGTPAEPDIRGSATIENGSYQNLRFGTVLHGISMEALAEGRNLRITRFRATDAANGVISARGSVNLEDLSRIPLEVDLSLAQAALIRMDNARGTTSGNIRLSGSTQDMALTGKLRIDSADISLPRRLPQSLTALDVVEINTPGEKAERDQPQGAGDGISPPFRLDLDLDVEFPARVFVRGRGLESEWKGKLDITGTAEKPAIVGTLSAIRGRMDFLGERFNIVEGIISFHGATPPAPTLQVTAEARAEDITAQIIISGPATDPKFELASEPLLPNDEILARLLFNRRLTELTPLQALKLARALNTLSGRGGGINFFERTRRFLGVEQLELREGGGEEGGEAVGIGKYLTEDVYVDVEKGVGNDAGKVSIEVEVTPNISVESDVGLNREGAGLGINWKYDY